MILENASAILINYSSHANDIADQEHFHLYQQALQRDEIYHHDDHNAHNDTTSPTALIARILKVGPTGAEDPAIIEAIKAVLTSREAVEAIMRLTGTDAHTFIDLLDGAMSKIDQSSRVYQTGFHSLRKLCAQNEYVPESFTLPSGLLQRTRDMADAAGSFADVWRGSYAGQEVAVKALRITYNCDKQSIMKNFCKEAVVWKHLCHPNITPFLGIDTSIFQLCMISAWMDNGDVRSFLLCNPEANRQALVIDVAEGLEYLHSVSVLHDDVKGANILVGGDHRARLSDFGLAAIIYDTGTMNTATPATVTTGSIRWMAPEVLDPEAACISEQSSALAKRDVHSFAMAAWEIFTGSIPYAQLRIDAAVIRLILKGIRPKRTQEAIDRGLSDVIWDILESCWRPDQKDRPSMSSVKTSLTDAVRSPSAVQSPISRASSAPPFNSPIMGFRRTDDVQRSKSTPAHSNRDLWDASTYHCHADSMWEFFTDEEAITRESSTRAGVSSMMGKETGPDSKNAVDLVDSTSDQCEEDSSGHDVEMESSRTSNYSPSVLPAQTTVQHLSHATCASSNTELKLASNARGTIHHNGSDEDSVCASRDTVSVSSSSKLPFVEMEHTEKIVTINPDDSVVLSDLDGRKKSLKSKTEPISPEWQALSFNVCH